MTPTPLTAHRPGRLVGGGLLLAALAIGTAACGSDAADPGSATGGSAATTADAPSSATSSSAGSSGAASAAACVKDSDYLSGTSTVIWTPDTKSEHQVAEVTPENEYTLTAAGKLDPATITVAIDEVFTVTMAADSKGISVLKIGCDGGQTMSVGTPAGVYLTAPGTYAVTSGLADEPAGTVVVQ